MAWDRLISKYASHTASSLLKLKSEFHNSKFDSIDKDPDEWSGPHLLCDRCLYTSIQDVARCNFKIIEGSNHQSYFNCLS